MKPVARRKGKDRKSKNKKKHKVRFSREDRLLLPEETIDDKDEKKGDTESEMDSDDDIEDNDDKIDNFEL